jgi:putative transposase
MPYGLHRYQQAESYHFITFSCYHRLPFLADQASKDLTEQILERTRLRHEARIYAYVLMPEHVHLLINEPPTIILGQFLKSFKQEVSRKLKGDRKQFWQSRYFDRNIRGDEAFSEVVEYIHQNPVKRGLVQRSADYRWCSLNHYATNTCGTVEIESQSTANRRAMNVSH